MNNPLTATESPPAARTALGAAFPSLAASIATVGLSVAIFALLRTDTAATVTGTAVFAAFLVGGTWLALIDAREHRIPDNVLLPLTCVIACALIAMALGIGEPQRILAGAIGAAVMFGIYLVLGLAGGIGFGDVKLAGLIGFYLTWLSPTAALASAALAYVFAAPHALIAIVRHRKTGKRARIPFGPYMVAAAATAVLLVAGT